MLLRSDQRALIVAMDHAGLMGIVPGLEDPQRVIEEAVAAGADGVLATFGLVKRFRKTLIGRIPTFLRLDSGPSVFREDWLSYTEWRLLHSVKLAHHLGVDGVVVMAFVGSAVELETLSIVSRVADECLRSRLPLIVEALPCPGPRVPDPRSASAIATAARIAFEHGADFVKTYYTGDPVSFAKVVGLCPAPILIAGGPRMDTLEEVFETAHGAIESGAAGVIFGRNIWERGKTAPMVAALKHLIHENGSVSEAVDIYAKDLVPGKPLQSTITSV